jgi:hypothetical protein
MRVRIRRAKIKPENRKLFEQYGPEIARAALGTGVRPPSGGGWASGPLLTVSHNERDAIEWLREKDDERERRDGFQFWITVLAAVAACLAAWPTIKWW